MDTVLLTGATGFLGYHVAKKLNAAGIRPRVLELREGRQDVLNQGRGFFKSKQIAGTHGGYYSICSTGRFGGGSCGRIDMLLGDSDRHGGQWKFARFKPDGDWLPIPRDRDYVFLSYEGLVARVMRMRAPSLLRFDSTYANASARFVNALDFDRRLLAGLGKPVWDSIAADVMRAVTDSVLSETNCHNMQLTQFSTSVPCRAIWRSRM